MNSADTVETVVEGERVMIGAEVGPRCTFNEGRWHCTTHHREFYNQFEKDTHLTSCSGKHRLVWVCHYHGPEVP